MTLSGLSFRIILANQLSVDFRVLVVFGLLLEAFYPFFLEAPLCASCLVSTLRQQAFCNTFINTIHISDSKLFSMFGLAHTVQSTTVRDSCTGNEAYPHLLSDIQEEKKGLSSLICDHVIDVDLLIDPSVVDNSSVVNNLPLFPLRGPANRM